MASGKYDNPFSATWDAIKQVMQKQERVGTLVDRERLDGKTCMVTGANSGLGFAIATQMAERGAEVIMVCRSGIPEAGEEVRKSSGSDKVEMWPVDLSKLASIAALCDGLKEEGKRIDVLVCNAAVVPRQSRQTEDGFDEMQQVNYLAKFALVNRLLADKTIQTDAGYVPRIIFISSESHRSKEEIDFEALGKYEPYSIGKTIAYYGYYKLLMTTFANALSRRYNGEGEVRLSVHALCPGPVNSAIAKEAPALFQPLLKAIFSIFFRDPATAAEPALYLACSEALEGQTCRYLHLMAPKEMDAKARDVENGDRLWARTTEVLRGAGWNRD